MKTGSDDARLLRAYLLGTLPEPEELRLEREYLADPELQQQLLLAEDDLLEAYLDDDLESDERGRLEARFLASPRGQAKLAVARALQSPIAGPVAAQSGGQPDRQRGAVGPHRRWSRRVLLVGTPLGAAALAVVIFTVVRSSHRPDEVSVRPPGAIAPEPPAGRTPPPPSPPESSPPEPRLATPVAPDPPGTRPLLAMARVVLRPGVTRQVARPQSVEISGQHKALQVDLLLDDDQDQHPRYAVFLLGAAEAVRWSVRGLRSRTLAGGRGVRFNLPAVHLGRGEHTFMLAADKVVGSEPGALPPPVAVYNCFVNRP